jgi:Rieske Fe-S protein
MTRKEFLKSVSGTAAVFAAVPAVSILEGCASSGRVLDAELVDNKVIIPLSHFPDLSRPGDHIKVYVEPFPNPFFLFHQDNGELWAVLSTCSHRGCEVEKLMTGFECPCHGSEYDLRGLVRDGPAPAPLESYVVQKVGDRLEFVLEGAP